MYFFICQIITALCQCILPVFPGSSSDYDQRLFSRCRCILDHLSGHRHFRMTHRPMSPPAWVCSIFWILAESTVDLGQLFIVRSSTLIQSVHQTDQVRRIHITAAAISDIEIISLAAAKNGHLFLFQQRKRVADVFQKDTAFSSRTSC